MAPPVFLQWGRGGWPPMLEAPSGQFFNVQQYNILHNQCVSVWEQTLELSKCRKPGRPHTHSLHWPIWDPEWPSFGSWLVIALADAAADDAPLMPPEIHDLHNKDIDMRKFERQLHVLPDLLNSRSRHASKVIRVCTLANMLAAAPLASSMFSEVDELVRINLTIPVATYCNWGKVLFCPLMHQNLPEIYHVPAAPQQHNAPQCQQGSDGWIGFVYHHQAVRRCQWTPQAFLWHWALCTVHSETHQLERLGLTLGTVRLELFGNLTTCILLYYTILMTTVSDCWWRDCGWCHACSI